MQVVANTPEVRTTNPVTVEVAHIAYNGQGVVRETFLARYGINAGHPVSLPGRSRRIDGMLTGRVKVTKMKNTTGADYFSLRLIGGTVRRTVYLRADAQVVVDGAVGTVADLWHDVNL